MYRAKCGVVLYNVSGGNDLWCVVRYGVVCGMVYWYYEQYVVRYLGSMVHLVLSGHFL